MADTLTFDFTPPRQPAPELPSARSGLTVASYRIDETRYRRWCTENDRIALEPASAAAYLEHLAVTPPRPPDNKPRPPETLPRTHAYSTILRRLAAIGDAFLREGKRDPRKHRAVADALTRIRANMDRAERQQELDAARPVDRVVPADVDVVRVIVGKILEQTPENAGDQRRALRDRALIVLMYAAALSREEARTLQLDAIAPCDEGLAITVNRSEFKRRERTVTIVRGANPETDPVAALQEHLVGNSIISGFVFRGVTDTGVVSPPDQPISKSHFARIVSGRVEAAGLDPDLFTPAAFRAAVVFEIARSGGTLKDALAITGHKEAKHILGVFEAGRAAANHPSRFLRL